MRVTRTKKGLKIMSGQGVLKKPGLFSLRERRLNEKFESFFKSHHVEGEIDLVCVFPEWRKRHRGNVEEGAEKSSTKETFSIVSKV